MLWVENTNKGMEFIYQGAIWKSIKINFDKLISKFFRKIDFKWNGWRNNFGNREFFLGILRFVRGFGKRWGL